ncbi:MAG: hypothetical protein M3Q34_03695 [bacterium]|nr:hypothetical protein [bacterium]
MNLKFFRDQDPSRRRNSSLETPSREENELSFIELHKLKKDLSRVDDELGMLEEYLERVTGMSPQDTQFARISVHNSEEKIENLKIEKESYESQLNGLETAYKNKFGDGWEEKFNSDTTIQELQRLLVSVNESIKRQDKSRVDYVNESKSVSELEAEIKILEAKKLELIKKLGGALH